MKKIIPVFIVLALVAPAIAGAQSATTQNPIPDQQRNLQILMAKVKGELTQQIAGRISVLQSLETSLKSSMLTAGASMKSNLDAISTQISEELTELRLLEAQIAKEVDVTRLRSSVGSLTNLYQKYELSIIKASIIIGASTIDNIANQMSALADKLTAAVGELSRAGFSFSGGSSSGSLSSTITGIKTSLEDARSQSKDAMNSVQALQPSKGDQEKQASNVVKFREAITKIQASQRDLQVAQRNIMDVIQKIITATPAQPVRSR